MKCPYCQNRDSRVVESRTSDDHSAVRRRRECPDCQRRFTTYERVGEVRLFVVKKDGRREPFERVKILTGMVKACEKRPVRGEVLEQAADEIERQVRDELMEEIPTHRIGALVMERLRELDAVAYVRFASVYKEFREPGSFVKEVEGLARAGRRAGGARQTTTLFDAKDKEDDSPEGASQGAEPAP
jgi:transcriptional repressor NrdR